MSLFHILYVFPLLLLSSLTTILTENMATRPSLGLIEQIQVHTETVVVEDPPGVRPSTSLSEYMTILAVCHHNRFTTSTNKNNVFS